MLQLIQPIASLFVGLCMFVYGFIHSITRFPGGDAFAALAANLPAVGSVLVFLLGLLAIVAGVVLVVLGVKNFRRRWRKFGQIARHVERQPAYPGDSGDDEGGWESEPAYR